MKNSILKGLSFGVTSGIITTLGLMIGMYSGTHSKIVVVGAILTIAVADAFSDALGIHLSEESQKDKSNVEIWQSTFTTFLAKMIFTLSFLIPVLLLNLPTAIIISIIYGLILIICASYYIAKIRDEDAIRSIVEHLIISVVVIMSTYYIGDQISKYFS